MTYTEKLIGRTIESIFCEECNSLLIMQLGREYATNCERCNYPLQILCITINSKIETDCINEDKLIAKRIEKQLVKK
jgi:hypothetical protein